MKYNWTILEPCMHGAWKKWCWFKFFKYGKNEPHCRSTGDILYDAAMQAVSFVHTQTHPFSAVSNSMTLSTKPLPEPIHRHSVHRAKDQKCWWEYKSDVLNRSLGRTNSIICIDCFSRASHNALHNLWI